MAPQIKSLQHLIGQRVGKLIVLEDLGIIRKRSFPYPRILKVQCDCGTIKEVEYSNFKKGQVRSCASKYCKQYKREDITGRVYGRLTVMEFGGKLDSENRPKWVCKCECGRVVRRTSRDLNRGTVRSCGCFKKDLHTTHGLSNHPLNAAWNHMMRRCYDPKCGQYYRYGGRGVSVCPEWRNDFMSFYNWAIEKWEPGLELDKDKLSPNKIGMLYCPQYCCFLTQKENSMYKETSRIVEYDGISMCLMQWAEKLGINYSVMQGRLNRGWTMEKIINTPIQHKKRAA